MSVWFAKAVVLVAGVVMVVIRAPYGQRSREIAVAQSRKGTQETVLLTIAWIAFFVPLIWVVSPLFDFADYPLRPAPWLAGMAVLAFGLWLFHRSHADLGPNWSLSLEVREGHRLVTQGLYRHIRHPMYLALVIYGVGQALALPNFVAGPSYLAAMLLLIAFRLGPEERMMREAFGDEYEAYAARTHRLIPGLW